MADKLKLLVADDEERIRYGLNRTLSARGYDVVTAENGRAALEVLQTEPVDVILLDLKMPVMSGERVLEVVHAEHPEIVVIVITGHGSIDSAVECMKKGAYDFIT
ncbi:MAG: response regulator, partial [Proteobacteria bacterium]|nr:response regulator [Pseudomonadota bacterium]